MSLSSNEMSPADIAAVTGGNNNGGFGSWGGDASWIIILFLFVLMANGGYGNGNGNGGGSVPYFMNTDNVVQRGFDTAAISGQLSGIQSSISNGFANAEVAECNRAMNAQATAYNNQIASMNQNFANQQALNAQLNGISASLQQCLKKFISYAKNKFQFIKLNTVGTCAM